MHLDACAKGAACLLGKRTHARGSRASYTPVRKAHGAKAHLRVGAGGWGRQCLLTNLAHPLRAAAGDLAIVRKA